MYFTTSHFFPSLVNTGGLSIGAFAGGIVFVGTTLSTTGALNGAGPVLNEGFLCVCMSDVTFFRSVKYQFLKFYYLIISLFGKYIICTLCNSFSLINFGEKSTSVIANICRCYVSHRRHTWWWRWWYACRRRASFCPYKSCCMMLTHILLQIT